MKSKMQCPYCKGKTMCLDSSFNFKDQEMYRLRECKECRTRFYTVEALVEYDEYIERRWRENHRSMLRKIAEMKKEKEIEKEREADGVEVS